MCKQVKFILPLNIAQTFECTKLVIYRLITGKTRMILKTTSVIFFTWVTILPTSAFGKVHLAKIVLRRKIVN